jgi:hypothetical protein
MGESSELLATGKRNGIDFRVNMSRHLIDSIDFIECDRLAQEWPINRSFPSTGVSPDGEACADIITRIATELGYRAARTIDQLVMAEIAHDTNGRILAKAF